eukprot:scaffold1060_cov196-Amphora_coffeaeformis.AAC.13
MHLLRSIALLLVSKSSNANNHNNNMSSQAGKQPPKINHKTTVAKTKWLELQTLDYTDQEGKDRKWDVVTRTTKPASASADAVVIIPLLKRYGNDDVLDTILVEQFRPPVGQTTVEFPAGLMDKGETPEQAALRELREETGYVGEACKTVPTVSRPLCMSPGLTDESVHVVVVTVDLDNPYNHNPQPELDDGEHIVLKRVSLKEGFQTVMDQGTGMPIEGAYLFALGLEIGKSIRSATPPTEK